MDTMTDYLAWRGDVSFSGSPFNEVDALILSQLSYCDFAGVVSENLHDLRSLENVAKNFESKNKKLGITKPDGVVNPLTFPLLQDCAKTERFKNLKLFGYLEEFDKKTEIQFSAFSCLLPNNTLIAIFRGTDSSIIGWKEDFNMAVTTEVPAQKRSVEYLEWVAKKKHQSLITCGHSKGGNLAIFSSAFAKPKIQKRIEAIYNNDGPGFLPSIIEKESFKNIVSKIKSFVPQSSVVGRLLEHGENLTIIKSLATSGGKTFQGITQHDAFSWSVLGTQFVREAKHTQESDTINATIKSWLNIVEEPKRKVFVESLFKILEKTNTESVTDLTESFFKTASILIKGFSNSDSQTQKNLKEQIHLFFQCYWALR